jgi:hypothetical protein
MASPDIITDATNAALRDTAADYLRTITIPTAVEGVHGFASELLGEQTEESSIWAAVYKRNPPAQEALHLQLDANDHTSDIRVIVDIDLVTPDGGPAAIVKPSYNDSEPVAGAPTLTQTAKHGRRVIRHLTEKEGQGLVADLQAIMEQVQAD